MLTGRSWLHMHMLLFINATRETKRLSQPIGSMDTNIAPLTETQLT